MTCQEKRPPAAATAEAGETRNTTRIVPRRLRLRDTLRTEETWGRYQRWLADRAARRPVRQAEYDTLADRVRALESLVGRAEPGAITHPVAERATGTPVAQPVTTQAGPAVAIPASVRRRIRKGVRHG